MCELTHALDLPQPKISHHLGGLRKAGLVCDRKEGLWIYYKIHPDLPQWVSTILDATVKGVGQNEPFVSDTLALSEMPNRPGGVCSA